MQLASARLARMSYLANIVTKDLPSFGGAKYTWTVVLTKNHAPHCFDRIYVSLFDSHNRIGICLESILAFLDLTNNVVCLSSSLVGAINFPSTL
jgi:hypothetical protein